MATSSDSLGTLRNETVPMWETKWWSDLMKGIFGPRKGGARIIIDAEDAETGVGKTGLAVYLARTLCTRFGYTLKPDDLTLSGAEYLQRWRDHPGPEQPSVLILDELGGAGAGHARRAMANQNVELGNSWQLMRKKRIVSIVTLPHWYKADKDMRQQADYRLRCLNQPIGFFTPYDVGAGFDSGEVRTRSYDTTRVHFPNLDVKNDQAWRYLDTLKDELLDSAYFDADKLSDEGEDAVPSPDEVEREKLAEVAQAMRDRGHTTVEIAKCIPRSQGWVSKNTDPPEAKTD